MSFVTEVSEYQMDALKEHLNIGMGQAAFTLNQMLSTHIHLELPSLALMNQAEFLALKDLDDSQQLITVSLPFSGKVSGSSSVVFTRDSAVKLVGMMVPEVDIISSDVDAITEATLTEVGNILINAVMGSLANLTAMTLSFRPPIYRECSIKETALGLGRFESKSHQETVILVGETSFTVASHQVSGKILIAFLVSDLKILLQRWQEEAA